MKRLTILIVLLMFVTTAFLHAEFTNEIEFIKYAIPPTTIVGYSLYDYMNGAYNGFPMRIHGDDIIGQGIYFTYMVQPLGEERKQHWAWAQIDAFEVGDRDPLTSYAAHREGFGTLAIDQMTGNPIFAWHSIPYSIEFPPPGYQGELNTYFTWDRFFWYNTGGQGWANDEALIRENREQQQEFNWPVVHFGPSPIPNKSRVYIFHNGNGSCPYQIANSDSGFMPSSNTLMVTADIGPEDWNDLHSVVWTETYFEYLEKIYWWDNTHHGTDPYRNARAYLSFSVALQPHLAGHVVLAGQVEGPERAQYSEWNDMLPEHNHVVILSKDYGESFVNMSFLAEQRPPSTWKPQYNPADLDAMSPENRDIFLQRYNANIGSPSEERTDWVTMPNTLNNKTVIFDNNGTIHFPSNYATGLNDGSYFPQFISTHIIAFNPDTGEARFTHIEPEVPIDMPNNVPFIFDLDNDGYMDIHWLPDGTPTVWPWLVPNFWHYVDPAPPANPWFTHNQMRLTESTNGYMAAMWYDSTKAYYNDASSGAWFEDFNDTPELMISMTRDSGKTWSKPYRMAYNSEPGSQLSMNPIANNQSFVYPADRLIVLDRDTVRLFFMYMDDFSYGSSIQNEGLANGTAIRYTAIDFDLKDIPPNENDIFLPRPESMLAQNFPNPFNPSTTIRFNIPQSGNVKLNVYNVRGQLVNTLLDDTLPTGEHRVTWTGVDNNGRDVASGIYFYRLETNGVTETKRMVLMK